MFIMNPQGYMNCDNIDIIHLEEGVRDIKVVFSSGHVEHVMCEDREKAIIKLRSLQQAICERTFNDVWLDTLVKERVEREKE